jgi:hypothetical protein
MFAPAIRIQTGPSGKEKNLFEHSGAFGKELGAWMIVEYEKP